MAPPRVERLLTAIDVGSSKVAVLIAGQTADGTLHALGTGVRESMGVKRGYVVDIPAVDRSVREALEQAGHELERLARDVGALSNSPLGGDAAAASSPATPASLIDAAQAGLAPVDAQGAAGVPTAPRTRAEALRQLQLVADFFRRTEPHSPVAYLADKAIKWGEMPLHRWLGEVVKDPASMAHLQELLGLSAPTDNTNA